jgi:glucose-6-phosphate-specific signal transduction histidine kinase
VTVTARKQGDATLIEVIDNGVGLPNGRKRRERTGLRVMQQTIYLLNEKHQQSASYHHGDTLMDYGMDNYTHADGQTGCRAWLLLPDHFDYTLR